MIVFGTIPSRRLGRSLGINNIPFKHCTYSCVYCQLGSTNSMTKLDGDFYCPDEIYETTKNKLDELNSAGEQVDYISFVPDGEPTLDSNLGVTIEKLKRLDKKIAVITNASLLYDKEIRNKLLSADWVSLKIDSAYPSIWKKINRPHGSLRLPKIINGMIQFASEFKGELVTETMLVKDINVGIGSLRKTAEVIKQINPGKAYILVPTRPPAETFVKPPSTDKINLAYLIFTQYGLNTELLTYNEGEEFSYTSNVEKELLDILSVHPMRKDAVKKFINKANSNWSLIDSLKENKKLRVIKYSGYEYYIKNFGGYNA
ncbi:MAG: radical SAM protein [Ignavibacteria bacterium]|jgi:wyosine [tRNA(Phe)-imidazoG37] synthetase (radical SAM superfamily)